MAVYVRLETNVSTRSLGKRRVHARALFLALATAMLAFASGSRADGPPEPIASFPIDLAGAVAPELLRGFALDASGSSVPAAYFLLWSESLQTNVVWVTDGSPEGTHAAANLAVNNAQVSLLPSTTLGAFFAGHDDATGWQIYRTDGAADSATRLTMEPSGPDAMLGLLDGRPVIARLNDDAVTTTLLAVDPVTGSLSDLGTVASLYISAVVAPEVGFAVSEPGPQGVPVAISSFHDDGTQPVTLPVPPPSTTWNDPHQLGGGTRLLCFEAFTNYSDSDYAQELYCSDGTAQGTVRPVPPGETRGIFLEDDVRFTPLGDRLLFEGRAASTSQTTLWITDGTNAGTLPLYDSSVDASPCSDDRSGGVYFVESHYDNGDFSASLAFTDGTVAGTRAIAPLASNEAYCSSLGSSLGPRAVTYLALGTRLYRTDGTPAGTSVVAGAPAMPGSAFLPSQGIVVLGRWLVFAAPTPTSAMGLWRIDLDPLFTGTFE